MGPLNSPAVTSYRLPIVTIGLSDTVFRLVTDRQTELVQQKAALCTKVHRTPKIYKYHSRKSTKQNWSKFVDYAI